MYLQFHEISIFYFFILNSLFILEYRISNLMLVFIGIQLHAYFQQSFGILYKRIQRLHTEVCINGENIIFKSVDMVVVTLNQSCKIRYFK